MKLLKQSNTYAEDLSKIARWGRAIGLDVRQIDRTSFDKSIEPFFPNVWVKKGVAYYSNQAHPGDLLHELGHIALAPGWLRPHLSGDLYFEGNPEVMEKVEALNQELRDLCKETPEWNALNRPNDSTVIAWTFVAAQACDIDDFIPFELDFSDTDGSSEDGSLIYDALVMSASKKICFYDGIDTLCRCGLLKHVRDFPVLAKWVQN